MLIFSAPLSKEKFAEYSAIAARVGRFVETRSESMGCSKRSLVEDIWRGKVEDISPEDAKALGQIKAIEMEVISSFGPLMSQICKKSSAKSSFLVDHDDLQNQLFLELRYALYQYTKENVQFSTFFYITAFNYAKKYAKQMHRQCRGVSAQFEDPNFDIASPNEGDSEYDYEEIERASEFIRSLSDLDRRSLLAKLGNRGDMESVAQEAGCFRGSINHRAQRCIDKFRREMRSVKKSA